MNLCTPGSISGSHWGEWTPGRFQSHQSADSLVWIEHVRVPCQVVQPLGLFASGQSITAGVIVQFKREGGWLLVSATRPNASRLVSFLSERQLPPPLRAFPQLAFLHSP